MYPIANDQDFTIYYIIFILKLEQTTEKKELVSAKILIVTSLNSRSFCLHFHLTFHSNSNHYSTLYYNTGCRWNLFVFFLFNHHVLTYLEMCRRVSLSFFFISFKYFIYLNLSVLFILAPYFESVTINKGK